LLAVPTISLRSPRAESSEVDLRLDRCLQRLEISFAGEVLASPRPSWTCSVPSSKLLAWLEIEEVVRYRLLTVPIL